MAPTKIAMAQTQANFVFELLIDDGSTQQKLPIANDTGGTGYWSTVLWDAGALHVAYVRSRKEGALSREIRYARYQNGSWTLTILAQVDGSNSVALAKRSDGRIHVAWTVNDSELWHAVDTGVVDGKDQNCDGADG
jgi:hypothetical protein